MEGGRWREEEGGRRREGGGGKGGGGKWREVEETEVEWGRLRWLLHHFLPRAKWW